MVTVAMLTNVFSESVTQTSYKWSILLFSVSPTVFELFAIFYNKIFLSRGGGQYYPILGPLALKLTIQSAKTTKSTCTAGTAPVGREKSALKRALWMVDEFENKK